MKTIIAKDAGYCFGVRDAVNVAYDAAKKFGKVYMLGDIVHNENVVSDLSKAGAVVVDKISQVPDNGTLLFRAHGTKKNIWQEAKARKINIIDATCPLVHDIHHEVKTLAAEGRRIIIIGDHGHDEVIAIADQVKDTIVISNPEEANQLRKMKKIGIVTQSTQMLSNVKNIVSILMSKTINVDLRFINTICFPTRRNHEQIETLSEECDLIIIIGSFTSANSKRLTELARKKNKNAYQVTNESELNEQWFKGVDTVGVSAGASTPDYIIKEVKSKIDKIGRNINGKRQN
tara:strand:+ start:96 stop:962 length:867 start_codon:yes stop_codon:yes gene_type:complete